jgi:hypothetical protein
VAGPWHAVTHEQKTQNPQTDAVAFRQGRPRKSVDLIRLTMSAPMMVREIARELKVGSRMAGTPPNDYGC